MGSPEQRLLGQLKLLADDVWDLSITRVDIEEWLANFSTDDERLHALHLLAHFSYFGNSELRVLLLSAYRDLFLYQIKRDIRSRQMKTLNPTVINQHVQWQLDNTHFVGVGGPSDSGTHLLYQLRQETGLSSAAFPDKSSLLGLAAPRFSHAVPSDMKIRRVVYVDDLLGSGTQVITAERATISRLRAAAHIEGYSIEIVYLCLFAKEDGLNTVREAGLFDRVSAVHTLDSTQEAFSLESRVYARPTDYTNRAEGKNVAERYGHHLVPEHPLGWLDGQLLLGFAHNTPDNTLPIFWWDEHVPAWHALFPRSIKK